MTDEPKKIITYAVDAIAIERESSIVQAFAEDPANWIRPTARREGRPTTDRQVSFGLFVAVYAVVVAPVPLMPEPFANRPVRHLTIYVASNYALPDPPTAVTIGRLFGFTWVRPREFLFDTAESIEDERTDAYAETYPNGSDTITIRQIAEDLGADPRAIH